MNKLNKNEIADVLALTAMQEGMLFLHLKEPDSEVNFEQLYLELSGQVDSELFFAAWDVVIRDNEMLRTVFRWESVSRPVQVVLKEHRLKRRYIDLSDRTKISGRRRQIIEELLDSDREEKFDLREAPFRVSLYRFADREYGVIISHSHILYDGWSNGILLKEFFSAYEALCQNRQPGQSSKPGFIEFVKWLQSRDKKKQARYWQQYLTAFSGGSGAVPRRKKKNVSSGRYKFVLPGEIKIQVDEFVKTQKTSTAALLYTAWGLLLQSYNRSKDVIFDTTVSCRSGAMTGAGSQLVKEGEKAGFSPAAGIEDMVGLFINTLPLRLSRGENEKIADLVQRVGEMLRQWEEYADTPRFIIREYLEKCPQALFFDSLFVVENYPLEKNVSAGSGLEIESFSTFGVTGYDLTVLAMLSEEIEMDFTYDTGLINHEIAEKIGVHFTAAVQAVTADPKQDAGKFVSGLETGELIKGFVSRKSVSSRGAAQPAYAAPEGEIEKKLAALWSSVLFGRELDEEPGVVTELPLIGKQDDFFDFGGYSLQASQLSAGIHKAFHIKMPIAEIFARPSLSEMAAYIEAVVGKNQKDDFLAITPIEKKEYYPLSTAQRRFYFIQQMAPDSTAYNTTAVIILLGKPDRQRLEDSFRKLIRRHESLRTSFELIEGELAQRIFEDVPFGLEYYETGEDIPMRRAQKSSPAQPQEQDVPGDSAVEQNGGLLQVDRRIEQVIGNFARPYDISRVPLLRSALIKLEERRYILLFDIHHIIADGVSREILVDDFAAFYSGSDLPPLPVQYKDFSHWQQRLLVSGALKEHEDYWMENLSPPLPVLNLPLDFPRPAMQSFAGDRVRFQVGGSLKRGLNALLKTTGTTLYMVFLALLNILLSKYTGLEDIVVGTPTANRKHAGLENIIGLLIEAIVLRNFPGGEKTFSLFLEEVKTVTLRAYEHQMYPFRELMLRLAPENDLSRNPLFDVMLNVLHRQDSGVALAGLECIPYPMVPKVSRVDVMVEVIETGGFITMDLEYCTKLFTAESMQRFGRFLLNILEEVLKNPGVRIADIEMLDAADREQLSSASGRESKPIEADFDF